MGDKKLLFREVTRALARRWYLVLLGVVLALGAAYVAWGQAGARYSSQSTTLLLPPISATKSTDPKASDGNPLLYLGGLGQARDVLLNIMMSESLKQSFEANFPNSEYTATADFASSGPIVVVKVDTPTPAMAAASARYLTDNVAERLAEMQRELSIKKNAVIRSMTLTAPTEPEEENKVQIRAAALVGIGILVVALLLIALFDGLLTSRRRGRTKGSRDQGEPTQSGASIAAQATDSWPEHASDSDAVPAEPDAPHPPDLDGGSLARKTGAHRSRATHRPIAASGKAALIARRARSATLNSRQEPYRTAAYSHRPSAAARMPRIRNSRVRNSGRKVSGPVAARGRA